MHRSHLPLQRFRRQSAPQPCHRSRYGRGLGGIPINPNPNLWHHVPESAVVNPSDTYALGDSFVSTVYRKIMFGSGLIGRRMEFLNPGEVATGDIAQFFKDSAAAAHRHGRKLNTALCDGHVEAVSVNDFLLNDEPHWKRRSHNQNIP